MSVEQNEPTEPTGEPGPIPPSGVHPDLLDWARQTFKMEEFLTELREFEAGRSAPLESFIADLEALVSGSVGGPALYHVSYSCLVQQRLRELVGAERARGSSWRP